MSVCVHALICSRLHFAAEVYHFQHERVVDFKDMMKFFLNEQIAFYQEVSECV